MKLSIEDLNNIEIALIYASRYLKGDSVSESVLQQTDYSLRLEEFQSLINRVNLERNSK